jgi:lysophospholipid acyltransferase (LPLAT)-like uncharacterized protein
MLLYCFNLLILKIIIIIILIYLKVKIIWKTIKHHLNPKSNNNLNHEFPEQNIFFF